MKSMKKSMLITTILMVVLLIVALSTATFAWYTAQSNVSVSQTWVTSAASSSASLVIDGAATTSTTATNTTITITMGGNIVPMQYNAAEPTAVANATEETSATTYAAFKDNFVTYTVDIAGKYASTPSKGNPAEIGTVTGENNGTGSFYVSNIGGANTGVAAAINIGSYYKITTDTVTADNVADYFVKSGSAFVAATEFAANETYYEAVTNNLLRVAMFVDGEYVGTWSNNGVKRSTTAVTIGDSSLEGQSQVGTENFAANVYTSGTTATVKANLASMSSINVQLLAWFEGSDLNNALANGGADFQITFNGTTAA